jgi:hypothetical protein
MPGWPLRGGAQRGITPTLDRQRCAREPTALILALVNDAPLVHCSPRWDGARSGSKPERVFQHDKQTTDHRPSGLDACHQRTEPGVGREIGCESKEAVPYRASERSKLYTMENPHGLVRTSYRESPKVYRSDTYFPNRGLSARTTR